MTDAHPKDNNNEHPRPETLAERSARLEAEAAAFATGYATQDPLAPEPLSPENAPEDTELAKGHAALTALQAELDAAKEQTVRALAEAENTRRRARKDAEDAGKFAITSFAKDVLEIADTLRRALESAPADLIESDPRLKNFIEGIEATERVLLKGFEKHGIQKLEPLDQPFNPNFHEVMFEAPIAGKPAGIVMQVLEAGYMLNDRLLRAAKVGVTKDSGTAAPPPQGGHIDTSA